LKPLLLSLTAFGPFAGQEIIDFRPLGERALFLVHGPTGAGKTSILDGICCALYGETSGDERTGKQMRSDHAAADRLTQVQLDFAVGPARYRVWRCPEQDRPAARGAGMTRQAADATLWLRSAILADADNGQVLATGVRDVSERIKSLLGFGASQFRQVVMLPQGQFRRLLSAASAERQAILAMLFETDKYRNIEQFLTQRAKDTLARLERNREAARQFLDQAGAESAQALEVAVGQQRVELGNLQREIELSKARLALAQGALESGNAAQVKLDRQRKAQLGWEALQRELPQQQQRKVMMDRARKAAALRGAQEDRDARCDEGNLARQAADKAEVQAKRAETNRRQMADQLVLEQGRKGDRDVAAERVRQLAAWAGQVADLEVAQAQAAQAAKAHQTAQMSRAKADSLLRDVKANLLDLKPRLAQAQVVAARLEGLQRQAKECQRIADLRQACDATLRLHAAATRAVQQGAATLDVCNQSWRQARSDLDMLAEARVHGQATLLARQLVAGTACPVCGATDHPRPATGAAAPPDEQTLATAREVARRAERELEQARTTAAQAELDLARHAAGLSQQQAHLGDAAAQALPDLLAAAAAAQAASAQAERQVKDLAALAATVLRTEQRLVDAETALATADADVSLKSGAHQAAVGLCAERERGIPTDLRQPGALAAARQVAVAHAQQLDQALEAATQRAGAAVSAAAAAAATGRAAEQALVTAATRAAAADAAFAAGWQADAFASEEDYRAACRSPAELDTLEAAIGRFAEALAAARTAVDAATAEADGVAAPDLGTLAAAAGQAAAAHTQALTQEARLQEQVRNRNQILMNLQKLAEQADRDEQEYRVLGRLAQTASGSNKRRLTFERYVLAALLDGVLVAASARLSRMTQGRYTLQRAQGVGDQRRAGGLELEVLDAHTGRERAVATLSGGEGFLAALSLALGLADVVQSQAGGIHLDAIFVDEGFGSLDPAALDEAIGALLELQAGGRLVGIISHVTELQSRIDARLEVVAGQGGSHTRLVLP